MSRGFGSDNLPNISPLVQAAYDKFREEFSELLAQHAGKWVAYRGSERLGIADTQAELIQAHRVAYPEQEITTLLIAEDTPLEHAVW